MLEVLRRSSESVYFYRGVDLPDEHVGGVESDGPGEQPEGEDHEGSVAEIQEGRDELHNIQLRDR